MTKRGRPKLSRGRERILDAAADEIERRGALGIQLVDVAKDAEVSRPTAYRLFPGGRSEIVEATVRRSAERLNATMMARLAECREPLELLVEGMLFTITEVPNDPVLKIALRDRARASALGEKNDASDFERPGQVVLARYAERVPQATPAQLESLGQLARRIGLSTVLLGESDELRRGGEEARRTLRAWLEPIVARHVQGESGPGEGAPPTRRGDARRRPRAR